MSKTQKKPVYRVVKRTAAGLPEWIIEGPGGPYLYGDDQGAAARDAERMAHDYRREHDVDDARMVGL